MGMGVEESQFTPTPVSTDILSSLKGTLACIKNSYCRNTKWPPLESMTHFPSLPSEKLVSELQQGKNAVASSTSLLGI